VHTHLSVSGVITKRSVSIKRKEIVIIIIIRNIIGKKKLYTVTKLTCAAQKFILINKVHIGYGYFAYVGLFNKIKSTLLKPLEVLHGANAFLALYYSK
jgi:hypothetical protein